MTSLGKSEKLALINENLAEVLNPEIIENVLAEGRNLKVYWGKRINHLFSISHCCEPAAHSGLHCVTKRYKARFMIDTKGIRRC